ncbi:MAG: PAS domain-containing sensor histidine kinase, partial [Candidatus Bathyarchaeia archaeon]
ERLAEEKLRESEKKYRTLFETSRDGIAITTRGGRFVDANQALANLFGYTKEELLKLDVKEMYANPEDREKFLQEMERKGHVTDYEIKARRRDGTIRILQISSTALRAEDGSISGYQSIIRDVTEPKRMEDELKRSKQTLEAIIENIPDPVFIKNPDSTYMLVNQAYCEFSKRPKEEFLGKTDSELFPPDEADLCRRQDMEVITKGVVLDIPEEKVTDALGTARLFHTRKAPLRDSEGNVINIVGIMRDITERKRMEEELRRYSEHLEELVKERAEELSRSRRFLETAMESAPDFVYIKDKDFRYVYANQAFCKFHGKSKEQVLGGTVYDIYPKEQADLFTEQDRRVFEKGVPDYSTDLAITDSEGVTHIVDSIKTPIKDGTGKVTHLIGISRDVSERKKVEQMKDRLISTITHELRTPLTSISGYVNLALAGKFGSLGSGATRCLEVIKRNTDLLVNITEDLLDIRRIESGKLTLNISPLNLKEIIDHCTLEIKPFLKESQELHVQIPDPPPIIQGDKVRLTQVLMNLLSNAAKFTPEGGRIQLAVEDEEEAVKIWVSDTGIGIRNEDLPRVFEPFAAIQKPTYIKGTGLGLNISKGLVEAHGGRIWAESEGEGKGATFTLTLPKCTAGTLKQTV